MDKCITEMATMAAEAATAQSQFLRARQIAEQWLDAMEGEKSSVVLLAATMVQAVAGREIGQHNGMAPGEVMQSLAGDMAMLADLAGDKGDE